VQELFGCFDKDKDGYITEEEFKALLKCVDWVNPPKAAVESALEDCVQPVRLDLKFTLSWFQKWNAIDNKIMLMSKNDCNLYVGNKSTSVIPVDGVLKEKGMEIATDQDEAPISISFPSGKSWQCKLR